MSNILQLKRITANYDLHKTTILANGEPIIIETNVDNSTLTTPFIVVGDGINTIETLIRDNKVFIGLANINSVANNLIENGGHASDIVPNDIGDNASVGTSTKYARADHTHTISKDIIVNTLGQDSARSITSGTTEPSPTMGEVGDIYIKYE